MTPSDIEKLKITDLKAYLKKLIERLDELDDEDFFGTEGWQQRLMGDE